MLKRILHIVIICLLSIPVLGQYPYNYSSNKKLWKDGSKIYVSVSDPFDRSLITDATVALWQNDSIIKKGNYIDSLTVYVIDTIVYGKFEIRCEHQDYLAQTRRSYIPFEYQKVYFLVKSNNLNKYHFNLGTEYCSYTNGGAMPFVRNDSMLRIKSFWFNTKGFDRHSREHLEILKDYYDEKLPLNPEFVLALNNELKNTFPKFNHLMSLMDSLGLEWAENGFSKYLKKKDGSTFKSDSSYILKVLREDSVISYCGPPYRSYGAPLAFSTKFYVYFIPDVDESFFQELVDKYSLVDYELEEISSHSVRVLFSAKNWVGYGINDIMSTMVKNEAEVLTTQIKFHGTGYN